MVLLSRDVIGHSYDRTCSAYVYHVPDEIALVILLVL